MTRNAQDVGATACTVAAASDLISCLELEIEPVESLLASVRALFGYFYPTEDFQYTGELAYYRQREWRILANMVYEGVSATSEPTDDEKVVLLGIDEEFFGRTMTFPTGEYRLIDQCQYLRGIGGVSVGATIRRVIAPQAQLEQVAAVVGPRSLDINLISLEELA